jgi:hypothetical protein
MGMNPVIMSLICTIGSPSVREGIIQLGRGNKVSNDPVISLFILVFLRKIL